MGVLYELLLRPVDHLVPALLASLSCTLDVGFNSSLVAEETGHMGVDDICTMEQEQHQRQRAFALHPAHALQALQSKAGGWSSLFQIISKYKSLLVLQLQPMGFATCSTRKSDCSLPKKLLSLSTSQISWKHFKAARDFSLLLVYCIKVGIQVLPACTSTTGLKNTGKENWIGEAICCFFRAASGLGEASEDLQSLFVGTGYQQNILGRGAAAAWRMHYYEWVMQIFELYNLSEGACQFAHSTLEQVDEAMGNQALDGAENPSSSTLVAAIKGRLWANVFKFSLDLDLYGDAYCAIISNPDEESKFICLRRFIVVLCERKVTKAENSDINAKPSPYKLLYDLHLQRHNWHRAAACMYRYTVRVREKARTSNIQEELHGSWQLLVHCSWLIPHMHGLSFHLVLVKIQPLQSGSL